MWGLIGLELIVRTAFSKKGLIAVPQSQQIMTSENVFEGHLHR